MSLLRTSQANKRLALKNPGYHKLSKLRVLKVSLQNELGPLLIDPGVSNVISLQVRRQKEPIGNFQPAGMVSPGEDGGSKDTFHVFPTQLSHREFESKTKNKPYEKINIITHYPENKRKVFKATIT